MSEVDDDGVPTGPCCNCLRVGRLRNLVLLSRRGPTPGQGWGCVECGLPFDGAVALLCDDCMSGAAATPRFVCQGFAAADEPRVPFESLSPEVFDHDPSKHPELME